MLFALVSSGLYVLTAIYSIGYMRGHHEPFQTRFFAMLCLSVGAALGIAFAANIFVLLVFYEILTLATYPLVAHDESEEARTSGYKYLAYALTGGLAVFGGMMAVFWLTGSITFTRGGIEGIGDVAASDPWAARAAFALLAGGFAVKAAARKVVIGATSRTSLGQTTILFSSVSSVFPLREGERTHTSTGFTKGGTTNARRVRWLSNSTNRSSTQRRLAASSSRGRMSGSSALGTQWTTWTRIVVHSGLTYKPTSRCLAS